MKIDLTEVVIALIGLLAAVVTGYLIPWIRKNTTEKQRETIQLWTSVAVKAAEQLYGSKQGEMKKKYVLDFLDGKGLSVDDAAILTSWGLLWAPVITGKSKLTTSGEVLLPAPTEGQREREDADHLSGNEDSDLPEKTTENEDGDGDPDMEKDDVDEEPGKFDGEDGTADEPSKKEKKKSIWTALLRVLTAVFDAVRKMIRGE